MGDLPDFRCLRTPASISKYATYGQSNDVLTLSMLTHYLGNVHHVRYHGYHRQVTDISKQVGNEHFKIQHTFPLCYPILPIQP